MRAHAYYYNQHSRYRAPFTSSGGILRHTGYRAQQHGDVFLRNTWRFPFVLFHLPNAIGLTLKLPGLTNLLQCLSKCFACCVTIHYKLSNTLIVVRMLVHPGALSADEIKLFRKSDNNRGNLYRHDNTLQQRCSVSSLVAVCYNSTKAGSR